MTTDKRLRPIRETFPELGDGFAAVFQGVLDGLAKPKPEEEPEPETPIDETC